MSFKQVSKKIKPCLNALRDQLEGLYGEQLGGVYLYGSYARGEEGRESDLDVLIVLDQLDNYGIEIARTSEIISSLSLKYGVSISRVFVTTQQWTEGQTPFLDNVREEAISA